MDLSESLEKVEQRIAAAAARAGRDPGSVELVAVSKAYPPIAVMEARASGHKVFGENRVQELVTKAPQVSSDVKWHLIGHLQRNKVRKVLPLVELIHSVDSVDLACAIDRVAMEMGTAARVLLQVNVAKEASKFGFESDNLLAVLDRLLELSHLEISGLMTIAPLAESAEQSRPYFLQLRELRDEIERRVGVSFPDLSMGMSGDYEVAIEEGATHVRVGSAIFGQRK